MYRADDQSQVTKYMQIVETNAMKKAATTKPKPAKAPKEPKPPKEPKAPKEAKPPKVPRPPKEPKAPKPKKAPAKKSRTVTDIVLAQYQPQVEVADGTTISSFFASTEVRVAQEAAGVEAAAVKTAIKRKRSRSPVKRDSMGPPAARPKKTTKKEVVVPAKLLSPATALKRLQKQDILFGTSSQLARDEGPTFIREIQQAIKESESQFQSQTKDDVTPVRASLATLRARRGLWNDGARGEGEDLLLSPEPPLQARQEVLRSERAALEEQEAEAVGQVAEAEDVVVKAPHFDDIVVTLPHEARDDQEVSITDDLRKIRPPPAQQPKQSQHIDLTSSDAVEDIDAVLDPPINEPISISSPPSAQPVGPSPAKPNVLQDLSTNKKLNLAASHLDMNDKPPPSSQRSAGTTGIKRTRSISPAKRSRLVARDPSPPPTTPVKRASPIRAITISSPPSEVHALDRSQKSVAISSPDQDIDEIATTPKLRPPECTTTSSPFVDIDTLTTPKAMTEANPTATTSSPYADIDDLPSTPNRTTTAQRTKQTSSPYADIDDIEDSEPELTSSPPRRRSPVATEKVVLELSSPVGATSTAIPAKKARAKKKEDAANVAATAQSPRSKAKSPTKPPSPKSPATSTAKPKATRAKATKATKPTTEEEARAQATLFKLVTKAITTAPPTKDPKHPSWYEKILLYDPIVLEDLAGWLNRRESGLRDLVKAAEEEEARSKTTGGVADGRGVLEMVDSAGQPITPEEETSKAKPKKKSAKGKAKAGNDIAAEGDAQGQDMVEIIKPALLQKWCEENSVCCLWRNGLRGGVKMKY